MRAFHTIAFLSLTCLAVPMAGAMDAAAGGPMGTASARPEIQNVRLAETQRAEGLLLYAVSGQMAPNSDAYLAPFVWDGRVRFVFMDAIVKVRSNSQGHFQGFLAIPLNYQLLQVQILPGREDLGAASTAPMSFLRHLLPLLRGRR